MKISPVYKDNVIVGYESGPVYTSVLGHRVWVSAGYTASTVAEICKLAFMNAQIRGMTRKLAVKMSVNV